jgi:hypothetical protein
MHPFRLSALVCIGLTLTAASHAAAADPPGELPPGADRIIADKLAVQTAMLQGRDYLRNGDPARAVAVLEAQLARIEGSRTYLMILGEAYQAYVTDLYVHKQGEQARKYLDRLRILDPAAAAALEVRPAAQAAVRPAQALPTAAAPKPAPAAPPEPAPQVAGQVPVPPRYVSPLRQATDAARPQTQIRAVMGEETRPNPFGKEHEMPRLGTAPDGPKAAELLARARDEFNHARYGQARLLLEQARRADPNLPADSADQLAYCKLNRAFEELQKGGDDSLVDLEREVKDGLSLSTSPRLTDFGRSLLDQIGRRRRGAGEVAVSVRHYADRGSGLQVAESAHFRVFHKGSQGYAEKVVQIAERTRAAMSRKWLGHDGGDWQPKCDLFLYATAAEYTQATGQPAASPGHTRIETDPAGGRVVSRRMHLRCDFPGMLEAVLPHETTHVVIAGQFGSRPVPRWVDEGIAVLSEPAEKVGQHRQNLARAGRGRDLFAARELMELPDYPEPRRISTFYAQSVSLVEYLSRQKGPEEFCQFVRDSLREGYESALRRHYGYRDFADLEARWNQAALAGLSAAAPAYAER